MTARNSTADFVTIHHDEILKSGIGVRADAGRRSYISVSGIRAFQVSATMSCLKEIAGLTEDRMRLR